MPFVIHLCTEFDGALCAPNGGVSAGLVYAGPQKLLHWLEAQLGCSGLPSNTEYLRIELYRQALSQLVQSSGVFEPFYADSLEADRYATAQVLLNWRDELVLSGWNFEAGPGAPARLEALAALERLYAQKTQAPDTLWKAQGFADRFEAALKAVESLELPLETLILHQPEAEMPAHLRRFIALCRVKNIRVETQTLTAAAAADTDLGRLQRRILGEASDREPARADGSLLLLHARRDSDAAAWTASLLAADPDLRPVLIVPEMNRALEQSLVLHGLPSTGILSSSVARPSLQVLKLAPALVWEPVDIFKVLEFVTLPLKPIDDGLGFTIARVLAEKPGLFSDNWYAAVLQYLDSEGVDSAVRAQYAFWFDRKRYRSDTAAPKEVFIEMYDYLRRWALETFSAQNGKIGSLPVLAEQARRIGELLRALPENRIGFLELERIVRTIYEPSPVQPAPAEAGRLDFVHQPGAFAGTAARIWWWNCVGDQQTPPAEKWQPEELNWLQARGVNPDTGVQRSLRQLHLRQTPILAADRQVVLIMPEMVEGVPVNPSLLSGDIEACFTNSGELRFRLDDAADRLRLAQWLQMPSPDAVAARPAGTTRPHARIARAERVPDSPYETPTNLESLFYYPHRWFFRQKLRIAPVSLYSISGDQTLLGNLAHRFFELMLKENVQEWQQTDLLDWMQARELELLEKEGATLLLYGREPEKNAFLRKMRHAAWSLITLLRDNGWRVRSTEMPIEGLFAALPLRGKIDLVLERGLEQAIVDLKWSGANRRREMIRNREDLQLVLYAHMLPPPEAWPHSAYFILEEGKMIARNRLAFREAVEAGGEADHAAVNAETLAKMERTFRWRMEQIRAGLLELRSAQTAAVLDELYGEQLFDLLEMKTDDARWDDFRLLINAP